MQTIAQLTEILENERNEYLRTKEQYEREISELPNGVIISKKIRGEEYFGISYYDNITKKQKQKHLKKGTNLSKIQEQLDRHKILKKALQELEQDLETIEKMLKPAQKHIQQGNVRESLNEVGIEKDTSGNLPQLKTIAPTDFQQRK